MNRFGNFILTNLLRNKEGLYSWRLNTAAIRHNYDEIRIAPVAEGDFLKPVLFVKGGLSDYIQAKNEAEIVKLFPAASVKTIMQAGHWPHAEKPSSFAENCFKFFAGMMRHGVDDCLDVFQRVT